MDTLSSFRRERERSVRALFFMFSNIEHAPNSERRSFFLSEYERLSLLFGVPLDVPKSDLWSYVRDID